MKKYFIIFATATIMLITACSANPTYTTSTLETDTKYSTEQSSQNNTTVNGNTITSDTSTEQIDTNIVSTSDDSYNWFSSISNYTTSPYCIVNNNTPFFTSDEITTNEFETYSDLDELGRCGVAYANICKNTMPTEERGEIGMIKPSGWHTVKYNDIIDGNYLYNRCHLIGYQLAGENANEKNLITGTRYLNVEGMLPFENKIADYVESTNNHVLYRVTPIFENNNLVASGVLMEAYSVEDAGAGIEFNIYCYNVQPGITIDYLTGDSYETNTANTTNQTETNNTNDSTCAYVLNKNSMKIHTPECSSVSKMSEENKIYSNDNIETLIQNGYEPCQNCNPK